MKIIHNPSTVSIKREVYGGSVYGNEQDPDAYLFPAGESRLVEDDAFATWLLEKYGFLTDVTKEYENLQPPTQPEADPLVCPKCGKRSKNLGGAKSHLRSCTVEPATPVAKSEALLTGKSRGQLEDEGFGNTDLKGVANPIRSVQEVIGGRLQNVTYDRDGVGWYGPGVEPDNPADFGPSVRRSKNRPGNF